MKKQIASACLFSLMIFYSCDDNPASTTQDAELPNVTITEPADYSEFDAGTVVTIHAHASDNEGIMKVEFLIHDLLVHTAPGSPYTYDWDTTDKDGMYTITSKAYDTSDNMALSDAVHVTINSTGGESGTVTDIDGNVYQTVKIGDQWWMAENLKVTHYRNGDPIPNVTGQYGWASLTTGAYCDHNNDSGSVAVYGRLYNWFAVNDGRIIAPEGWHVPSDDEWQTMVDFLGGTNIAGGKMKEAGLDHWNSPNTGATNESGFNGLPCGFRNANGGFTSHGSYAYFWSSTEHNTTLAGGRTLNYTSTIANAGSFYKLFGVSVRCIMD